MNETFCVHDRERTGLFAVEQNGARLSEIAEILLFELLYLLSAHGQLEAVFVVEHHSAALYALHEPEVYEVALIDPYDVVFEELALELLNRHAALYLLAVRNIYILFVETPLG